jgi:2-hydroxychromene-2-carboxylate isomerase
VSLKTVLMPLISQHMLSEQRLIRTRARAEQTRVAADHPHVLHYFHQVDDPYSALAAQSLAALLARYDVQLKPHLVGPPADAAAPERDMLVAYSRKDAQLLAAHYSLDFLDPGVQPTGPANIWASQLLVSAIAQDRFVEWGATVSQWLWQSTGGATKSLKTGDLPLAQPDAVRAHIAESNALRQKMGHYLGATFYYGGEWYWGIDRLYHLEQRLQALGAAKPGIGAYLIPPAADLEQPSTLQGPASIDFFFSLRSPYSALVAPRIFELGRLTGAEVRLRFLLPMVMRGLPVPKAKRNYIARDAAREARARGIPFGRINDPVGKPTERGLSLIPYAERAGKGQAYVLSFMRGVWAEGINAGSDRGLRTIVERCGLPWQQARTALLDSSWRERAEANRQQMFGLGLWGVPLFHVGTTTVWGQDRLWAVQDALLGAGAHP